MHLVVLDSVGIGAAPDANDFVNAGVPDGASDTLGHISKSVGLNVPNMVVKSFVKLINHTQVQLLLKTLDLVKWKLVN